MAANDAIPGRSRVPLNDLGRFDDVERAGGLPSQSIFRAALYTGRILFVLILASFRSVPPRIAELRRRAKREAAAR